MNGYDGLSQLHNKLDVCLISSSGFSEVCLMREKHYFHSRQRGLCTLVISFS